MQLTHHRDHARVDFTIPVRANLIDCQAAFAGAAPGTAHTAV